MPLSSPNAAATASDMDKNSGSNSSSASSGSSKGQQPPRSASAGPAGESKPKSGKGGPAAVGGGECPYCWGESLLSCLLGYSGTGSTFYYSPYLPFSMALIIYSYVNERCFAWFTWIIYINTQNCSIKQVLFLSPFYI